MKTQNNLNSVTVYVWMLASACLLVVMCGLSTTAQAQDVSSPSAIAKLQKPVHITVGSQTLAQIAAQLSQQTGLTIEATPYLRQHQITAQCDGASAQSLLETFAELNDWQWQERSGKIVIERKIGRKPRSIAEIPTAVQRAMAKDERRYLMDGAENTVTPVDRGNRIPAADTIAGQQARADLQEEAVSKFCEARGSKGIGYAIDQLTRTVRADCPDNKRLYWKKMTDWQRRLFVAYKVIPALSDMHRLEGYQVLHGRIQPYYTNMQGMQIEMPAKNTLQFGLIAIEGKYETGMGIGLGIDPNWLPIDIEKPFGLENP